MKKFKLSFSELEKELQTIEEGESSKFKGGDGPRPIAYYMYDFVTGKYDIPVYADSLENIGLGNGGSSWDSFSGTNLSQGTINYSPNGSNIGITLNYNNLPSTGPGSTQGPQSTIVVGATISF